ncbi:MAG: histone deacetylase, partial [Planctomycetota bacterium]
QHLFEADGSVLYASLHQYPHYPGTGAASERGRGEGEGATLNCPQPAGSGDADWLADFEEQVLPRIESFDPQLVIISAGFDAHALDPLSDTRLTEEAYRVMTRGILDLAREHCAGRVVSLLEGGYSLSGLARSVEAHVGELRVG